MKILFDHQLFSYQRYGGASKYFCELLYHLPRNTWETTTLFSNNEYVKKLRLFDAVHFPFYFKGQGRMMNVLNKPYSYFRLLQRKRYDVFHQTHFETYCLPVIGNKPMVTTFHDINFSTINYNKTLVNLQKSSLKRADKIVAVSMNTKKDLMNYFDIDDKKITVIYHGIELTEKEYFPERRMPYQYILYVGNRYKNKNFDRFLRAFALLNQKYREIKLICTWLPFSQQELRMFHDFGIADDVFHISATETSMYQLYHDAEMFVYPSLYEGFGLPILEAMAAQCPVILSDASCFPEIAKDAGAYFDPHDVESMVGAMDKVLSDSAYRNELVEKGRVRVKDFSWEKCAEEHLNLYKSLL